ncbi:MAG: transcriptional regulator [Proteobacteria bacterium]|mgnify:FL=1|jgi:mRNA-degrading endonuclease RelE of RelBE toxin-antitoxin system|nr:transcriptional regulator [Ramlibacter sp.]MCA0213945.1 transcriptional regulator [Pseudomonadota bacterium]
MLTVIETSLFLRCAKEVWSEDEREAFVEWIAGNPSAGSVIPGAEGLRKVRWGRAGMGKRGGSRVIYFLRNGPTEVVLIVVYTKAKFENLPTHVLLQWKEAFDGQGN